MVCIGESIDKMKRFASKFWRPTNIYESLIGIYYPSRLAALAPYAYHEVDEEYIKESSIVRYNLIYMIFYIVYYTWTLRRRILMTFTEESYVSNMIDEYQRRSVLITMISLIVTQIKRSSDYARAIKELHQMDVDLKSNGIAISYNCTKLVIFGLLLSKLVTVIVLEYFNCSMFLNEMNAIIDKNCWWLCYGPQITFATFECQFISALFLLYERAKAINDLLIATLYKRPNIGNDRGANKLRFVRTVHRNLCEIALNMNRIYSLQILLMITLHFVIFVCRSYNTFSSSLKMMFHVSRVKSDYIVWNLLWTLYSMFSLFGICLLATITQNEISKTSTVVNRMPSNFKMRFYDEIILFNKQLLHSNIKFTAMGLFSIDMFLFTSVISAATTYFIILIQLERSKTMLFNKV